MIELFAGIGGFRLASDWVGGIETIVSVEINPFCQKVLKKNFPNTPIYDDVTTYKPSAYCDLVVGGSPCQDLSVAGAQKGIIEGKRSSLWFEQLRIYKESRATFLIWENVAGAFRNGFREVLRSLSESGYDAEWQVISAAALGAPHLRERIFLIAYPTSLQFSKEPSTWADQVRCQVAIAASYPYSIGRNDRRDNDRQNYLQQEWDTTKDLKPRDERRCRLSKIREFDIKSSYWASIEPPVCGVDAGLPNRLDRLSALGNTIVPQCAVVPLLRVKYLASLL
jgi:DNA (cytosine-5)-methyltransferase 1